LSLLGKRSLKSLPDKGFKDFELITQQLYYLPQYEKRGLTWTNLLSDGKIPKTDADIQRIFTEQENLKSEIQQKIESIRQTYKELDKMVTKLYENT